MKVIYKPWGKEEWLELNENYCYKRIYINAGYKTSFQYHNFKKETNFIISGQAEIWLENDKGEIVIKIMGPGEFFNVLPPKKHRVIAITDIILQEVSTPEVDDVIRIEDDTNRQDGKLESEHKTPSVLILAAGEGTRLKTFTKYINKALIPINNKAIISHIINKFPIEYEIIITLGYKGESLQEYLQLAHPNRIFKFIDAKLSKGPGDSSLLAKEYLQKPFYLITADCIIDSDLPHLDGNWLGVAPTSYPEKYSTVEINNNNITKFTNKNLEGYENAFIGLAGIWNYEIFWKELEKNIKDGEVVGAFENSNEYPNFKVKFPKWLDTGNLDDLNRTKEYFLDKPISLSKNTGEITYKIDEKFIKFHPDQQITYNKAERAKSLMGLIPKEFGFTKNFLYYYWTSGKTLYECNSYKIYEKFLYFLKDKIAVQYEGDEQLIKDFYVTKTQKRKELFIEKYGEHYYNDKFSINGKEYKPLKEIYEYTQIPTSSQFYELWHGDLQFDNIIYNESDDSFTYIDWRDSFAGDIKGGDIYYDLAKLYGGCIIPYNLMKDESNFSYSEGSHIIEYKIPQNKNLDNFKEKYESWLISYGFDLEKVKLITALIFLNMSPLHDEKFSKILWFKAIEMLSYSKNG